jgi:tubulin delta
MPATIVVQVGQCGNQIGPALFRQLAQQAPGTAPEAQDLFRTTPDGVRRARCLLIDTEPKVRL